MKHRHRSSWLLLLLSALLINLACSSDGTTSNPDSHVGSDAGADAIDGTDQSGADAIDGTYQSVWIGVDDFINEQMATAQIAGLAVGVVSGGEVVFTGSYGLANIEQNRPVTGDTPFMLASVSKTVTATALMQTVEKGQIDLNQEVGTYVTFEVDNPRVDGESIIMMHLATHTSGIKDNWDNIPYGEGDSNIGLGEFVEGYIVPGGDWYDALDNFHPWAPGTEYDYGNVATALAGYVIEVVAETPFDDFCETHIFKPLGMSNTGWHLADFDPDDVAMPYKWSGGEFAAYGHYGYPDYPDGQLRSSVSDLSRFLIAIMQGGVLDGTRILEQATIETMLTPQVPAIAPTQMVYWYQTEIDGRTVIGHNGGDDGVATEMFFDPELRIGVILLMNVDRTTVVEDAAAKIEVLLFERAAEL
jgi:CubicO group peptidase (beta-lactamase class C family)